MSPHPGPLPRVAGPREQNAADAEQPDIGSAKPVLVIAGPTASGKSALGLALAKRLGGVLVNADSMQLYRELSVLTARPSEAEMAAVPHRLFGILPASEPCSAGRWREMALAGIAAAHAQARLPILVGGTGLYLEALMRGIAETPSVPAPVREAVRARLAAEGPAALHAELAARDPVSAAKLEPADRQRIARALEVLEATGRPLSQWQAEAAQAPPAGLAFEVFLLMPPRAALYAACDRRFARMVETGALDEVRALRALALDPALPAMKAIGVAELGAYLAGKTGLAEAIRAAQRATRRYAKRQFTWFRHRLPEAVRIEADPLDPAFASEQFLERFFRDFFSKICHY